MNAMTSTNLEAVVDPVLTGTGEKRAIPTSLGRLAVYDTGAPARPTASSKVLVLWPSILADHRIYSEQVAALRERHRLILIDGPGHGASGAPAGGFSMADCARAQLQVLDALAVTEPVITIGTSWGGLVAGEFALAYPDRTCGVVMFNTPVFTSSARGRDRFVTFGSRWLKGTNVFVKGVAESYFMPSTRERERGFMADFSQHIKSANGAAMSRAVRSVLLEREDLASRLSGIAAPTLFVAGTNDPMCPVAEQRDAAARLPRGRFVELPTAHIAVVDAPTDSTLAIERFLERL